MKQIQWLALLILIMFVLSGCIPSLQSVKKGPVLDRPLSAEDYMKLAEQTQAKKVTQLDEDTTPTVDDLIMTIDDPGVTPVSKKVTLANIFAAGRDFAKTSMTNGDTQTAFSEANMLATKYLTNQGETVELDVIFVAVSYPIGGVISNEEAQVIELCPPSGEIIYLDGVALDADDCVDSDGVVGSLASYLRFQDASAAWHYHILSITGAWTDTAGTD